MARSKDVGQTMWTDIIQTEPEPNNDPLKNKSIPENHFTWKKIKY